ncbi:MAG: DUF87 domain-containing protein [Elusimicrobiota bacterium]|jgi:hypothetical protein|nr:DUF87 domain-containing protein [Elusimicrobiota bacterium]
MKLQKRGIVTRLLVCIVSLSIFLLICRYFSSNFGFLTDSNSEYNILFVSGALLLLFGTYITEPFFTKPVDVLSNSIAVILALLSIKHPNNFFGYSYVFYFAIFVAILSLTTIIMYGVNKNSKIQILFCDIATKLGSSKIMFSIIYLLTIISYFYERPIAFIFFITFWTVFITEFIVVFIADFFINLHKRIFSANRLNYIGKAIGCENPFLYIVEIDYSTYSGNKINNGDIVLFSDKETMGVIGLVVNNKHMVSKQWLSICILRKDSCYMGISEQQIVYISVNSNSISQNVYLLDLLKLSNEQQNSVKNNEFYKNKDNFIGYVIDGSNINKIKFLSVLGDNNEKQSLLKEGTIITTNIYGQETLFQIIEGITTKESLESHNTSGYIVGIAQKLGKYDVQTKQIDSVQWVPNMYSPLFFKVSANTQNQSLVTIGCLPNTDMLIEIKDIDSLITHNTAILGILGIGKSCLTFELIKKVYDNTKDVKIICIDITNEYSRLLPFYIDINSIEYDNENIFSNIKVNQNYIHQENNKSDYTKSGNESDYKKTIRADLLNFLFGNKTIDNERIANTPFTPNDRVRIYNPDFHPVSKGEKIGFNVITVELTQAEKTRRICEEIFKILMKMSPTEKAKVLLIFEEAHSLIPEWNSSANEGDSIAVNGTAKVILQGRKYGLGSFIVTQRTANISKSILNQCNTIFSLRVFDDTGKTFLENYIGNDYSSLLPTLEERHAIVVGKALKLRLPIMIKLNDKDSVQLQINEEEEDIPF